MAVKKKKDEEQLQPQRNSTYSYGRENGGNAYKYGSDGEVVSSGKNLYSSNGYKQQAASTPYSKSSAGSVSQKKTGSTWTPGGSNPSAAERYKASTLARIKAQNAANRKWYSGAQPTLRETVARMYQVANGDKEKFAELEDMLYQEMATPSSVIYNPYNQATNTHAIEVLEGLGIDMSGGVTPEWLAANKYMQNDPRTVTGYSPLAPSSKSTAANDLAWAYDELEDAEERTLNAENEVVAMANEVKYLVEHGYSDKAILKKVKENKTYGTLWEMDDKRLHGEYSILNRAINYNGDDTIYGMIWAARNDGGSGDYFVDSVKYAMGEGNQYKRNPDSEAARDPTSESYDPYSLGGTMHDLNIKYGVNDFTREWVEANRASILSDPDGYKDIESILAGIDNQEKAAAEVAELDKWLEKQVSRGNSLEDITARLEALIKDGGDTNIDLPTLKKMEDKRFAGTYLALAGAVDFTLPNYIAKAADMVAQRDAAAAEEAAAGEAEREAKQEKWEKFKGDVSNWVTETAQDVVGSVGRFLASMGIKGIGSYGEAIDNALAAQENAYDANTIGKNFASGVLGVDIHGDLNAVEKAAVEDMVAKVEAATRTKASEEDIQAANDAVAVVQNMLTMAAQDPARQNQDSYETRESWTSVASPEQEEPREGMADMVAETTAYTGEDAAQADNANLEAYRSICQGGEWDGSVIDWALSVSDNPMAIKAEIGQGIIDHVTSGAELTGLAKSWWDRFGGLVDNIGGPTDYSQVADYEMHPENYDSRRAYGTQVYGALKMNTDAYKDEAISASQYAANLLSISSIAEAMGNALDGERATDEQADAFLRESGAEAILEQVYNVCNSGMEQQQRYAESRVKQVYADNAEVIRQIEAGEPVTDQGAFFSIMTADTTEAKANDAAYKDAAAYIAEALSFDSIADSGIAFTTGDKNVDAAWGNEWVQNEGAAVYSKGVTALAQAKLETNMKYAAACGLSLEEFYTQFPKLARTPDQIVGEARAEYNGVWNEFGHTLEGLAAANESILNAGGDAAGEGEMSEDTLEPGDLLVLAMDKVTNINALNWEKSLYMMRFGWLDEVGRVDTLKTQYSNDRSAYAADLDAWEAGREANLRKVYENDGAARQSGMSYEDWRIENTDTQLDELRALRETSADIFDIGLSPEELDSQQVIISKTGNIANIDQLVAENGSEFDQTVYNGATSLMQSGQFMYKSVLMGGGFKGSLISSITSSGGDAFDRFQESGDYDASMAASIGAWVVNAAIESSVDRLVPEALGGKLEEKQLAARSMLMREGFFGMLKDPKSLSKAAQGVLAQIAKGAVDVAGEGVEEGLQAIVDSIADNAAYGTGYILSGEQLAEAGQAAVSGAAMGAIMGAGSAMVFGTPKVTDHMGNMIKKAEALLLPEHDGVILNSAIDFEATAMAITNTQEALAQIANSSENAALKEATEQIQEVDAELAEAEAELQVEIDNRAAAALALAEVDNERVESDVFTEDMSKRMVADATAIQRADQMIAKRREHLADVQARKAEIQKKYDDLKTKIQGMYNQVMDKAKAKYAQMVTDKYFGGDSEAQKSAGEAYLEACRKLEDAKDRLISARADVELFGRGTLRGGSARIEYGRALLEVDSRAEEVAAAKAEMEAAYAETAEGKVEAEMNADLAAAQQAADEAQTAADADPMNMRKQLAADHAKAQLDAVQAQQELEGAKEGISARLKDPDSKVREQAVADWKGLQKQVSDAVSAAKEAEALFNETDTQKNLRAAIDNMKQYTNDDLIDSGSENHAAASRAYAELQVAQAAVDFEKAWNDVLKGDANVNSIEYNNVISAYKSAVNRRMQSPSNTPEVDWAYDLENGTVFTKQDQGYEVRTGRGARSVSGAADSGNRSDGSSNIQAWRNTGSNRGAAGSSEVTTVDQNPIEIMRDLTDSIQVGYSPNGPMNEGRKRVSSDILAFYNARAKGIRVRSKYAGDLGIGLHEFGHAAHARLANLRATSAMIDALPDSVKKSYTDAELDGEAIAEFVVEYMYGRDRAVRAAGEQFVRDFERMMRVDPELNAAISKARNQVELWNNASAAERAAAMIKDSSTARQRDKAASKKGGAKRIVERVVTEVFDANEPLRKLGKSVYDAAKWSRWASNRADVLMKRNFIDTEGNIVGKSLTERLDDIGLTADMEMDAATYGVLQVALEHLEQKKPVFAESEFSRDDLIAVMKEIKDRNPIAAQAADVLSGFWKDVMDIWLVPNGLVKEDVRDSLWQMYPHYLPTKRVVDVDWNKKDVKSGTFKIYTAKKGGVSLEVINPFQSIADMVDQVVRSVSRNQVMQEIDAVLSGGGLEWLAKEITEAMAVTKIDTDEVKNAVRTALDSSTDVDPDLAADAFNLLNDMEEQLRSTGRSLRPNVIAGRRADGTAFYYQIQQGNEDLFRAAMNSKAAANSFVRVGKKITGAFTQLITQMNPAFVLKNTARDLPTSVNTGTWAYTYLDGAAKWMWGLYQIATDSKLYQEFEAVGGGTHTRLSGTSEKKLSEFRRDVLGKKDALPVRAAKLGMKIITLSSINDIAEVNSRFVEYALGKHDRNTFEGRREAAIAAQDVTVDFGMAGANDVIQGVLAFIPFGRAALNGTYKSMMMIRNIGSSDPRTRKQASTALAKTVINNGLLAAAQAYVIGAIFGGDEDDERKKEEYALITDEMKAGYFMIPLNQDKTNAKGYDRPWVRVALSQDIIGRTVYAFALNQALKAGDADALTVDMMSVAKSIFTDSLPGEAITANISNAMMNRTWYGGEIVSSYLMDSRSGVNQYKDDTPGAFKTLSNAIYNASGKEVSPAVLQYVFEQSTGYVGKVVIPFISGNRYTGEWSLEDAGKNLAYSFMKNFTLDPLTSNSLSQEYDDITDKIDKIVSEAEEGLPITYLAYSLTDAEREEAVAEAQALQKGLMKQTKAENNALWQEIIDIEASTRLSDAEKAIQEREVRREIDHNTAEALAELGEYMQTYVYRDPWISDVLHLFDTRPTLN